ncbi:thiamine-phosphate pyrophosphorylase [Mesobacillus campisalis]|uniref:Thiamine-phosphate synthase n=1 Tax=Mesobacillus campisalis TaxID=1408103 RepID=A0A0M2SWJ4_9BACI|nr:thiamine phosphate synthase [Mesobacillus campisalis]KKK38543.1 thiamine-phosphate pyrophosphorylase [Mesobacillus campisalis]
MGRMDSNKLKDMLKVYFIMGSANCRKDPAEVLTDAISGGITMFQYREKGEGALQGNEKWQLARRLRSICHEHAIPFIVNDDIELALEVDADGVHIGQEDENAELVRKKIGNKILGVSVHDLKEAEDAIRSGADYFGVGPIFATTTKSDAKPARGGAFIRELRDAKYVNPIVGIGGIVPGNAATVMEAGADGVSVITALTHAHQIQKEARLLKEAVFHGSMK